MGTAGTGGFQVRGAAVILFLLFLVSSHLGGAETGCASTDLFLARLQEASGRVQSFSCEFTQEKTMSLFRDPVRFQGRLSVERPDRLRWEFISPVPSVLMLNGTAGTRCDERMVAEKFSLKTDPVMQAVAQQLWLWLGGDYSGMAERYHLEEKDGSTLLVTPKDPASAEFISSVIIIFDETNLQPEKVHINEPGGNLTTIVFKDPEINKDLPARLFTDCRNE